MNDLVRATLARPVAEVLPGGSTRPGPPVPPPTVLQALTVYARLPGAIAGDEGDIAGLARVVGEWLPDFWRMRLPVAKDTIAAVLPEILRWLGEGAPSGSKAGGDDAEGDETLLSIAATPWHLLVGDYCRVYNASPEEALRTPWPLFLLLHRSITAVVSRDQLRSLPLVVYPNAKEPGEVLERIAEAANPPPDPESPQARRAAEVEALDAELGQAALRMRQEPTQENIESYRALYRTLKKMKG